MAQAGGVAGIRLHPDDASLSTAKLHFAKAINPLNEAGIVTLGRLVNEPDLNLSALRNFGKKSLEEVQSAKAALAESIDADGRIDWDSFAEAEDRILVPQESACSPLKTLSTACESLLALAPESPDALILKKRVLPGDGREEETLDVIARQLNLTRERVRQMELNNIISPLREAFLFDHYTGLSRRLRTGYPDSLRTAYQRLGAATDGTLRTEEEWTRVIAEAFGVTLDDTDLVNALPLLRLLLNYERVQFGPLLTRTAIVPAVITGTERERMRLVTSRLQKILKTAYIIRSLN